LVCCQVITSDYVLLHELSKKKSIDSLYKKLLFATNRIILNLYVFRNLFIIFTLLAYFFFITVLQHSTTIHLYVITKFLSLHITYSDLILCTVLYRVGHGEKNFHVLVHGMTCMVRITSSAYVNTQYTQQRLVQRCTNYGRIKNKTYPLFA